jgi:hypothetical protein
MRPAALPGTHWITRGRCRTAAIARRADHHGIRVAGLRLPPEARLLLADHVKGSTPILVYRLPNLSRALAKLTKQGWKDEATFEIPHGPICSFRAPGGQRIALYELTRPAAGKTFEGRRDF